ncbi:hypothetical protein HYALB_00006939 [Hymenoscyphus albidus]|uniref:Uncharacterized protein n=1 Tax=Hymenoscyphus albidus TaxID=595503 RepID=A0A9N9LA05_9HELO|nr:hypothetical protein HYALB_00006939 [Hymenoscyphus albidus]
MKLEAFFSHYRKLTALPVVGSHPKFRGLDLTMFFIIAPLLVETVVFILTALCITAGQPNNITPSLLSDYYLVSVDTTNLQAINASENHDGLPIHDYYKMYLTTQCSSNHDKSSKHYFNATCSKPSNNAKFNLRKLISNDLENDHDHPNFTKPDLTAIIPKGLQLDFESHNEHIHVAYGFYMAAVVWAGLGILTRCLTLCDGTSDKTLFLFHYLTLGTFVFISSVIVTVVAREGPQSIERYSDFLTANGGDKILALTWTAYAFCIVNTLLCITGSFLGYVG